MSLSRSRRPHRLSHGSNSSSSSTSPERGVDDDNDSFMLQANDSTSSLGLSITQEMSDVEAARQIAERQRRSPISRLPAELMIAIFSKLSSPADLKSCMLVSKDWSRNSVALLWYRPQTNKWPSVITVARSVTTKNSYFDYANLIRRLNLSTLAPEISDGTLWPLASCKRIERLTLTNCVSVTDNSLVKMIDGNRSLLALDVTGLDKITDRTMTAVAENCVRLQGLNVTNCKRLTDVSLEAVARNCRHVKRLKFNGCSQLTDRSIMMFAEHCHQILEIDLHNCNLLEDESVTALITEGRHLRELRLAHCTRITDQAFLKLPMEATYDSLRILDLTDCGELMDAGVARIISAAPRLRNLVLAKCRHLTDRAVSSITKLGKNLHYIHLGHCARITDAGVIQLVKLCNRIRYIDLACCTLLTDNSVQQLATLPKLKRIGLVKCGNITDRSILALSSKTRGHPGSGFGPSSLERVHLSYCTNLTLSGIHSLLNNCPRLTHLSLTGVQAFLRDDLLVFCREAPSEFNEHQREVFCVFSGHGVSRLRNYFNSDQSLPGIGGFDTETMYDDGLDEADEDAIPDDEDADAADAAALLGLGPVVNTGGHHTHAHAQTNTHTHGLGFIGVGLPAHAQVTTPDIIVNIGGSPSASGTPSPFSPSAAQNIQQPPPPLQQHAHPAPLWHQTHTSWPGPPQLDGAHSASAPAGAASFPSLFGNTGSSSSGMVHPAEQMTDMMGAVGMRDAEMGEAEDETSDRGARPWREGEWDGGR